MQTTIQLPGHTYRLKIAVHPTEGWPVVGIMQRFSESADPIQSFVRVFNGRSNKWGPAQQVDIGRRHVPLDLFLDVLEANHRHPSAGSAASRPLSLVVRGGSRRLAALATDGAV